MIEKDDNVVVYSHMSDTKLRNIINERKHLSPERATSLLKRLDIRVSELLSHETFEKKYQVFHTKESIFYSIGYGRPDPYFKYIFLDEKFILYIYIGSDYIGLDFNENINTPTNLEKQTIVDKLLHIFQDIDFFWVDWVNKDNLTIEFIGE